MGADGVFKTWAGQFNAYQSKFRTGRPALTWQERSTFMGLTDQVGGRVLFTNCDDLPSVMDARSGFYCILGSDLERLTKDDLAAMADWLRGSAFTPKRKEPRDHQSEALEAILGGLEQHDRVTAVMACATGKTLVSLWLAERRKAKRVLVLVPSLALVRQTLHEWLKETQWEQPRFIAVCSDPTVAQGVEDTLIVHQRDLDFPTTDVGKVRGPSQLAQLKKHPRGASRKMGRSSIGLMTPAGRQAHKVAKGQASAQRAGQVIPPST
jgi:predicted helicase